MRSGSVWAPIGCTKHIPDLRATVGIIAGWGKQSHPLRSFWFKMFNKFLWRHGAPAATGVLAAAVVPSRAWCGESEEPKAKKGPEFKPLSTYSTVARS